MIGRLVEHQKISPLQQQQPQRQARPLATGKGIDRFEDIVVGKEEPPEKGPRRFLAHRLGVEHDRQRGADGGQLLVRLGVIADLDIGAKLEMSLEERYLAHQCAQQRGFAAAIWPNQTAHGRPARSSAPGCRTSTSGSSRLPRSLLA